MDWAVVWSSCSGIGFVCTRLGKVCLPARAPASHLRIGSKLSPAKFRVGAMSDKVTLKVKWGITPP
jgi:hypothetical protein